MNALKSSRGGLSGDDGCDCRSSEIHLFITEYVLKQNSKYVPITHNFMLKKPKTVYKTNIGKTNGVGCDPE